MAYVHDLRSTLFLLVLGAWCLVVAAFEWSTGADLSSYLFFLASGVALLALVGDGIQRRLRGDPRTRSPEFDDRTIASTAVTAVGLVIVGLWSASAGHPALTWRPLVLLGTLLLPVLLWKRRARRRDATEGEPA